MAIRWESDWGMTLNVPEEQWWQHRDLADRLGLSGEWLQRCIIQHHCDLHVKDTSDFLPTRLIDVGRQGQQSICLVLSKDLSRSSSTWFGRRFFDSRETNRSRNVNYATLSYCWGKPPQAACTTDGNLEERLDTIPIQLLPKTIQDAVHITRALNIQYLWVDALCIIQNNQEDWRKESASMGRIYSHSLLTIAASGAKDSSEGCYYRRDAVLWPVFDFTLAKRNTQPEPDPFVTLIPTLPEWRISVEHSALAKRGWALQERLLSRRTLFWTEDGLFWDCTRQIASEYEPELREHHQRPIFRPLLSLTTRDSSFSWTKAIEEFSEKALTVATDRLLAVVGLGNELSRLSGNVFEMSVGVWKEELIQQLAWVTCSDRFENRTSAAARSASIPSWSWASVHERVRFRGHHQGSKELIEVLSTQLPQIQLRGRMGSVKIQKTTSDVTGIFTSSHRAFHVGPCTFEPVRATDGQKSDVPRGKKEIAVFDTLTDAISNEPDLVQCLQWISWYEHESTRPGRGAVTGCLMLAPVDKERAIYRRIGWLEVVEPDSFDDKDETITLV